MKISILTAALLLSGSIHAQNLNKMQDSASSIHQPDTQLVASQPEQDGGALSAIVISGNRLKLPFAAQNRNIQVLDRMVIDRLPVKSVNELLSYAAGVDVRQRGPWGGQADIGLDGGTFDQTLILVNGIRISDPQTGHNMMNLPLPLDAIERVEILRGPAARIYGINALNGAINLVTRKPTSNQVRAHVYSGSNFSSDTSNQQLYWGLGLQASVSLSAEKAQHYVSISRDESSGYRYNTALQNSKIFHQSTLQLKPAIGVQILSGYVFNKFGANGFYAAPGDKESEETVQTGLLAAGASIQALPNWTLKPRISYRYNHDDYRYIKREPELFRNRHETHGLQAEIHNSIRTSWGTWGLGMEYRKEIINSSNLGNHERDNYGLYAEYAMEAVEGLKVNLGAYLNYNPIFGWKALPGIDAGYQLSSKWRAFANAGTGQRLPTYTDWYYKGPQNIGNDQLEPEYAYNTELGIKYSDHRLNASASYFYKHVSNFIDWVKDSITDPWQPQNYHRLDVNGLSLTSDYRIMGDKNATIQIIAGLSYTWLDIKVRESNTADNQRLSRYALEHLRQQLCIRGSINIQQRLQISLTGRYQQRVQYTDYFLADLRCSYDLGQFNVYMDLSNLGNVQYIEAAAVPMPGRWLSLGLRLQLGMGS